MSNDTFWPSFSERMPAPSTAVAWTNTSLPPSSGAMKPKPLEVLKNFTVPMVMSSFLLRVSASECRTAKLTLSQGRKLSVVQARTQGGQVLWVRFTVTDAMSRGRDYAADG